MFYLEHNESAGSEQLCCRLVYLVSDQRRVGPSEREERRSLVALFIVLRTGLHISHRRPGTPSPKRVSPSSSHGAGEDSKFREGALLRLALGYRRSNRKVTGP